MVCLNCLSRFRDDDPELVEKDACLSCGCPHFLMDDSFDLLKSVTTEVELKTACAMLLERMKSRGVKVWTGLITVKNGKVELIDPVLGFQSRNWDRLGLFVMSYLASYMVFKYPSLSAVLDSVAYWFCFLAVFGNLICFCRRLLNPYRNDFWAWLSTQFMFAALSIPAFCKAFGWI